MNTIRGQPSNSNHVMGTTHIHKLRSQGWPRKESPEMQYQLVQFPWMQEATKLKTIYVYNRNQF